MPKRIFSKVLQTAMDAQGVSWNALVERSGVSRATLARLLRENGGTRLDALEALAKALGLSPTEFWRD